jgi:hypothetical protein
MLHWSDIAIEQEAAARVARHEIAALAEERIGFGKGLPFERELKSSMMAIAASAHALDALYGEIRDLAVPTELYARWNESRPARPRRRSSTASGCRLPIDSRHR